MRGPATTAPLSRAGGAARASAARHIAGGALWIGTAQFFFCAHVAAAAAQPAYDGYRQVLSDLGVGRCALIAGAPFCSPLHGLFAATLVVQGLCMAGGAALLRDRLPRGLCAPLIALAGVSLWGIAAFPEDVAHAPHLVFAGLHCVAANAVLWLLARAPGPKRAKRRRMRLPGGMRAAIALGAAIGTVCTLALLDEALIAGRAGVVERFAVYPFPFALAAVGLRELRIAATARAARRSARDIRGRA